MVSAGPWLDRGHYLGFIILCMFSNCKLSQIKCIELEIYKAPRVGVTLTRPTLMGLMCVLLQPQPCRLAPRSGSCPHVPHPIPCFSGRCTSPLWGSAPMATTGGHIQLTSSSLRPQGWGHVGHPHHPTMEWSVVGCCCSPWCQRPRFPYPEAPGTPKPPSPAASPDP